MKRISIIKLVGLIVLYGLFTLSIKQVNIFSIVAQAAEKTDKARLNYEQLVMDPSQTIKLKLTGASGNITWKSSNTAVATVSKNGTVTARSYGSAVITASVAKKKFTCKVTVTYAVTMNAYEHWEHYSADFISEGPLIILDMNKTFEEFESVGYKITGVYAAVHSDKKIYVEGFDKKGKSLGIHENQGLSYFEFKNAVKLRIMNPDKIRYTINFIPAKPTVIEKSGYYRYEDFLWYELKDGNIQAPYIFAMDNPYMEYVPDKDKNEKNNDNAKAIIGYLPHFTGNESDPDYMGAWKLGYISAIDKKKTEELTGLWIYVDKYKVYIDEQDFFAYGKVGLNLPENFKDIVYSYRDSVRAVATKYYLPDSEIWEKPFRIRFTYDLRSAASENYMCMNINDDSNVYYHELTHYYHLEKMDYGCQISAWTEGIATTLSEDAVMLYDEDKNKGHIPFYIENSISDKDLNNFEEYFLNVDYNDCYTIGYYFIRFIQKEYGESVVLNINYSIKNIPTIEGHGISRDRRSKKLDKLFIQAIKDATSEDVFIRFVNEVLIPKIEMSNIMGNISINRIECKKEAA
jgi:hypothetical protein